MFSRPSDDLALLDQALGRLVHAHRDARRVVLRGDDEVGHRDDAVLVGLVVVEQRAARRLDHADAHRWASAVGIVRMSGLVISGSFEQLDHALGRLEHLDHARPVVGQRVVHRLAAQRGEELLVGLLRQRRGHAVGGVQPRQRRDRVDAALAARPRSPSSPAASGSRT